MATLSSEPDKARGGTSLRPTTPTQPAFDRWIFPAMALWFIVVALAGFIPSSLQKLEMVRSGARPPFPLVLHVHAVLMGLFLLLLVAQSWLEGAGRSAMHKRLGMLAVSVAALLVVVGVMLVPSSYHSIWDAAHNGPPLVRDQMKAILPMADNIILLQIRIGLLFPLFLAIGVWARRNRPDIHGRMMLLATALPLSASTDRMAWLPSTMPASPLSSDLYVALIVAPIFVHDLVRRRAVHPAYMIWLAINLPFAIAVHGLWDTPGWHQIARQLMGVAV